MLVPFKMSGDLPPFYMMHGIFGLYMRDSGLVGCAGPERPVFGITAPGYHGAEPPCTSVSQMAEIYTNEILAHRQSGPRLIGAFCEAGRVAIEVARRLAAMGEEVAPVLLIDPGAVPYKNQRAMATYERALDDPAALAALRDLARQSVVILAKVMGEMPFDPTDVHQLNRATATAMATKVAITRFVPEPYRGATCLILSADRAPGFFKPGHPWQEFLRGPRVVHVLDGDHTQLIGTGRFQVRRLIRVFLDSQENLA